MPLDRPGNSGWRIDEDLLPATGTDDAMREPH